jgi:hypothetical protein
MSKKPSYEVPKVGQPVTSIIQTDARTPKLKVKFCNIITPFHYPNSPGVPRYSVTCVLDPEEHRDFIEKIIKLEKKENIIGSQTLKEDVFKDESGHMVKSGKFNMKFQTRDKIPVVVVKEGFPNTPTEIKNEIVFGDQVVIIFEVMRYTKKGLSSDMNKGISYQPKLVYLYPHEVSVSQKGV